MVNWGGIKKSCCVSKIFRNEKEHTHILKVKHEAKEEFRAFLDSMF